MSDGEFRSIGCVKNNGEASGHGIGMPLIYAHRGARSLAPENTLAAAWAAARVGAHGWEFDVRITKDGELILIHDDTLERTTNAAIVFPGRAPWRVREFTLAEIRVLDAGSWFVEQDPFGTIRDGQVAQEQAAGYRDQRIPTLREALEFSRTLGLRVNIELKATSSNLFATPQDELAVEKTVELVRELGLATQVIISSFNPRMLKLVKDRGPEIKTALLLAYPVEGLLPLLRHLRVDACNPEYRLFSYEVLGALRREGFEIYVWTVNEDVELERFCQHPYIHGVITDWPQKVVKLVKR
ncbi:MAG: glycerophosphodiester phosphodiesterase family protein [Candidatus Bipolaricaulaceae bacterium]